MLHLQIAIDLNLSSTSNAISQLRSFLTSCFVFKLVLSACLVFYYILIYDMHLLGV